MIPSIDGFSFRGLQERVEDQSWEVYANHPFTSGHSLVPDNPQIQSRVTRLMEYLRLFNGWYGQHRSIVNYHDVTATFLSDVLMSRSPELSENPLSNRFSNSLLDVLPNLIIDTVRYGTGLLRIVFGDYGLEVTSPSPTHWFPTSKESSVLLERTGDGGIVVVRDMPGTVRESSHAVNGNIIGENLSDLDYTYPIESAIAVGEETTGRIGSIMNVAREPNTGDWGRSLYASITEPAMEINSQWMTIRSILEKARPYIIPENDDHSPITDYGNAQDDTLKIEAVRDAFHERLVHDIFIPPRGVKGYHYEYWDGTIREQLSYVAVIEEQLYALTYIPAALYGLAPNVMPPSGSSLSKQYIRTAAYIEQTQSNIARAIRKCFLMGMAMDGRSANEIRSFNEEFEITWTNIFNDTEMRTTDESEESGDTESIEQGIGGTEDEPRDMEATP